MHIWPECPNEGAHRREHGRVEVGVFEDDIGALAAELEREAFEIGARRES